MTVYLARVRWGKILETVGVFTDRETAYAAAKRYVEDRDGMRLSYFVEKSFVH
jgi:hypothetical protein